MADSSADIPVWENAAKSITVDASPSLKNSVEAIAQDVEHIGAPAAPARHMLRALRPHQWLKNLLVFVPMLAAHQMTADNALTSLSAFVAFCLVASSVYVLNDLLDLAADRAHPRKKERPFASGRLHIAHGTWLAPVLFLAGFLIALAAGKQLAAVVLLYFIVTTAYSLYLKRLLILDICTLAGLYTLRVIGGGAATGIPLSIWLLAFSIFFFFALATIKRQAELLNGVEEGKEKALGRGYHVNDLPTVANMATASGYMSIMILSLYLNSLNVQELYASPSFLWGICLVLLLVQPGFSGDKSRGYARRSNRVRPERSRQPCLSAVDPGFHRYGSLYLTLRSLVIRYAAFAILATVVNLATQRAVLAIDGSALGFALAVAAGTGAGLIVKYLLDKRWVFDDRSTGLKSDSRKFPLYTATGIVTTLIFWGSEASFWLIWQTDTMRELGAVLGLSVGYVIKYNLDRRYVFATVSDQPVGD